MSQYRSRALRRRPLDASPTVRIPDVDRPGRTLPCTLTLAEYRELAR